MNVMLSVTRFDDLLDFGEIFKACGKNYFAQISHILGNFCKYVKIIAFSSEIILRQLLKTFGDFLLVKLVMVEKSRQTLGNICKKR